MINVLIDDLREPGTNGIPLDVLVARNDLQGVRLLIENQGKVATLYLDHDLGDVVPEGETRLERTGYSVIKWLEEFPQYCPEKLVIVSSNSVGRQNIQAGWEAIQRRRGRAND